MTAGRWMREADMWHRAPGTGLEPGAAALRMRASVRGAPALTTAPCDAPLLLLFKSPFDWLESHEMF